VERAVSKENAEEAGTVDPSPQGEGGRRAAPDGWGHRSRTDLPNHVPRGLRKRMTPQEVKLWNWLREEIVPTGHHFRRQVPMGRYVVDFACLKQRLVVEIDGDQHGRDDHRATDRARDAYLASLGFRVLRFSNQDVDRERRVAMDSIYAALTITPPVSRLRRDPPSPQGEGSVPRSPESRGAREGSDT